MSSRSIEDVIRRAMEEGKFDDLPGKGKPLDLGQNPHTDPEWRAAHHILKTAGFSLPWIEILREIEGNLQEARTALSRTWSWYQAELNQKRSSAQLNSEWEQATRKFHEKILAINKNIRSYNLDVPNEQFQLQLIDAGREIDRIKRSVD
jgi:DnaJ family protein C protein 28